MGSLGTCCLVLLIMLLALAIFTSLLIIPVRLWHPTQFYNGINAVFAPFDRLVSDDSHRVHWGYGTRALQKLRGLLLPKDWGKKFSDCDLSLQSPIHLETMNIINNTLLVPLEYLHYDARPWQDFWTVTNNGHTVMFSANFSDTPRLTGGGLVAGEYEFRQLHFHWGANDTQGSEHAINGKHFPVEVHLVHVRPAQDLIPYKIAVLGILYELTERDEQNVYSHMQVLGNAAAEVLKAGSTKQVFLPGFTLSQFISGDPRYFRYYGSLTTPPCSQHLQWTVMANPLPITKSELEKFRQLLTDHDHDENEHILDNFRPFQNVTGRVVNYFGGQ